jgi:hypothetical protein
MSISPELSCPSTRTELSAYPDSFASADTFPPSDYYRPSAPPRAVGGRRAFPTAPAWRAGSGRGSEVVPTFTVFRFVG